MSWTEQTLMFSAVLHDLAAGERFGLVDCGARDNIPEPWASFERRAPQALRVLAFEPDPDEARRLNAAHANRRTVAAAAWNAAGRHALYITDPPQASSLFPPNTALDHLYAQTNSQLVSLPQGRRHVRTIDVPTTTIDATLADDPMDIDVIKIDTQGAEYEILEGAAATLRNHAVAVIAETWTLDVYRGIRPAWDVMALMAAAGYELAAMDIAGLARRSFPDARTFAFLQREQVISQELLFFRGAADIVKTASAPAKVYKAAAICDVYGFPDRAVELLTYTLRRWPDQIAPVKRCYDALAAKRAASHGVAAALYHSLNGTQLYKIGG